MAEEPATLTDEQKKFLFERRAKASGPLRSDFKSPETPKLGPVASSAARPLLEAGAGILSMVPDFATKVGNLLPESKFLDTDLLTGERLPAGRIQEPGQYLQGLIDQITTAPTDKMGKAAEFVNSLIAGGAVGPKMPRVPNAKPGVQRLANEGVTMTPGQRRGGIADWLEEQVGKFHPSVKTARAKAVEQWNNSELNQALRSAGGRPVPEGMKGHDAIRHAYDELSNRYSETLSKVSVDFGKDAPFKQALTEARALYSRARSPTNATARNLGPTQSRILKDIIDNEVIAKFTREGKIDGENAKNIERQLRVQAERFEKSESYDDNKLAGVLYKIRDEFKAMVTRQNPQAGAELEKIDKGYAQYKASARAANYASVKEGVYTPGQKLQAIRARDTSVDKNRFATGTARGQKETEDAQRILGNKTPDSGTPAGLATLTAMTEGPAWALGHPLLGAGVVGGPMAMYSQPVLQMLQRMSLADREALSKLGIVGAAQQAPNPIAEGVQ